MLIGIVTAMAGLATTSPAQAATWGGDFPIAPPGHSQPGAVASVARSANNLDVFWIGPDGGVGTNYWNTTANRWGTPFAIAPAGHARPGAITAVARSANNLDVFWIGPDGGVGTNYWNTTANRWGTPYPVAPPASAQPGAVTVLARNSNTLDLFWIRPNGAVATRRWEASTGWAAIIDIAPAGHARPGAITAVARSANNLDVFWIGPDGGVGTNYWNTTANRWGTPFAIAPAGHARPGAITAVARSANNLDVFWIGPDGGIGTNYWNTTANRWGTPYPVAAPAAAQGGALAAVARTQDSIDLAWITNDNAVASLNWNHRWGTPNRIAGASRARPAAISLTARRNDHLDAFWVGPDGGIGSTWWDLTTPAAPGLDSTPFNADAHGYNFVNQFQWEPLPGVTVDGLCGGMVYSALDHYTFGRPIPAQSSQPPNGSPLYNYLKNRQYTSVLDNADKWTELGFNPGGIRNSEFYRWGIQGYAGGRLDELRREIDAGRPVPLGLWAHEGGSIGHHQVLAIGYDTGRYAGTFGPFQEELRIFVYDPNHPNAVMTLRPVPSRQIYAYDQAPHHSWLTYFVDMKYRPVNPPVF